MSGVEVDYLPVSDDLPIYLDTVKATGILPWRVATGLKLLEVSLVKYPANPHTNVSIINPQDVKYL